jgi:hypothetical protein
MKVEDLPVKIRELVYKKRIVIDEGYCLNVFEEGNELTHCFNWFESKEGYSFWKKINDANYQPYIDIYGIEKGTIGVKVNCDSKIHNGVILKAISNHSKSLYYAPKVSQHPDCFRLATRSEEDAYNRGIRNISEIGIASNKQIHYDPMTPDQAFKSPYHNQITKGIKHLVNFGVNVDHNGAYYQLVCDLYDIPYRRVWTYQAKHNPYYGVNVNGKPIAFNRGEVGSVNVKLFESVKEFEDYLIKFNKYKQSNNEQESNKSKVSTENSGQCGESRIGTRVSRRRIKTASGSRPVGCEKANIRFRKSVTSSKIGGRKILINKSR